MAAKDGPVVKAIAETIAANPRPRDGRTLMKRFAEMHFDNCPAGGQGRKRNLGDVEAFLEFAVKKAGAPPRGRPTDKEYKRNLRSYSHAYSQRVNFF